MYELRWHSVSVDDGHATDGTYSFGVQVAAPAGSSSSPSGPLAGSGWLRVLLRAEFDAALLLFSGGVFCAAMLGRGRGPAAWLLPDPDDASAGASGAQRAGRLWRRTVVTGVAALGAGALSTLRTQRVRGRD